MAKRPLTTEEIAISSEALDVRNCEIGTNLYDVCFAKLGKMLRDMRGSSECSSYKYRFPSLPEVNVLKTDADADIYSLLQNEEKWGYRYVDSSAAMYSGYPCFEGLDADLSNLVCALHNYGGGEITDVRSAVDYFVDFLGGYTEGEQTAEERISRFISSHNAFLKGEDEELCEDFLDFLKELTYVYGDISYDFFRKNLGTLLETALDGYEGDVFSAVVVTSKALYNYQEHYRLKLPEEVRTLADTYVDCFSHPYGKNGCLERLGFSSIYTDHENGQIVLFIKSEENYDEDFYVLDTKFNPFFSEAVRWLDANLMLLEKEYGGKKTAAV